MQVRTIVSLSNAVALAEIESMPVHHLHRLPLKSTVWVERDGKPLCFTCDRDTFESRADAYGPSQYTQLAAPGETFGELSNRLGFVIVRVDVVVQEDAMQLDTSNSNTPTASPSPTMGANLRHKKTSPVVFSRSRTNQGADKNVPAMAKVSSDATTAKPIAPDDYSNQLTFVHTKAAS